MFFDEDQKREMKHVVKSILSLLLPYRHTHNGLNNYRTRQDCWEKTSETIGWRKYCWSSKSRLDELFKSFSSHTREDGKLSHAGESETHRFLSFSFSLCLMCWLLDNSIFLKPRPTNVNDFPFLSLFFSTLSFDKRKSSCTELSLRFKKGEKRRKNISRMKASRDGIELI